MFKKILIGTCSAFVLLSCASNFSAPESEITTQTQPQTTELEALVSQMTIDEKLAQISCIWMDKSKFLERDGSFNPQKMKAHFPHGAGCIARPQDTIGMEGPSERKSLNDSTVVRKLSGRSPGETVELVNIIQKWMMEETRLGIPTLFHEEGLHGLQGLHATSFPQSIGLASTFDTELIEQVYSIVGREIRARGVHHVLSPVVDVALDPRWGRIEETFGEDPFLVSEMGVAAIKGFQGTTHQLPKDKVLTTLKHMTGHGQPEAGMNIGPSQLSERVLREVFFPPFEAAIKAGAASVMASYNEIDGIPSHANPWLLNDILRGEWGFDGPVVADYFAINELEGRHQIVGSLPEAGALALQSGVDMELPDGVAFYSLKEKLIAGELDETIIDRAVLRVLQLKQRAQLFSTPFADANYADQITGNSEARELAYQAAIKAPVLLKNENNTLPLNPENYKKIAVIGPNSDIVVLGGYSDEPRQVISILDGIKERWGDKADIIHSKGVELTNNRSWWDDEVVIADRQKNLSLIEEAVQTARDADLIILAIGGDESTSREAWSETHMGDRNDITLIGEQTELVEALSNLNKPMVGVIISGRPLSLEKEHFDALLYGWLLGQETGYAIADLLSGKAVPSGKMPVTVPRSVGQIPAFYNHKPTARRGYAFGDASPLYAFGHGLSYSTFEFSDVSLSQDSISPSGITKASVSVTNTGAYTADEVVQLYIRDDISSVTRPVLELKGFKRISLDPGASEVVTFEIRPEHLQFFNREMKRVVEPGSFTIMIGNSSTSHKDATLYVTE
ncbi:glycoside hydrolase family 3 N-terminal domain-containing protein [Hirschia baltica]|uniref:Beta-D-glucoside glucohydrolase n=1 Tax=Hirschia baltica (strain ATCC 49814 / DSM 5838 / IFAM 1418) TaxID=582402 RepID=C6XNJ3_HIRBI|nr:glycoside hydrolase family 3 N-terminal domain-containing protein [Hirschia baltica]ACT60137.1 glycoside hydrolase family 3 domain protein [Hirschia baltica ATCC 49814]